MLSSIPILCVPEIAKSNPKTIDSNNTNYKFCIRDINFLYEISKNGSTSFKNLQTAFSLGGREIVTFIQYGYFLDIDIEIEGMLHKLLFKLQILK